MISSRSCRSDSDVAAVRELLIRSGRTTTPGFLWDVRRWDGQRFYNDDPELDQAWAGRVRLWEAGGLVVGCVHPEESGDAWIEVEPGFRDLEPAMLEWSEQHLVDDHAVLIHALDGDRQRRDLLAERGYEETSDGEVTRIRRLDAIVPDRVRDLPAGYRLDTIDSSRMGDRRRLADLLNAAFGRDWHGEAEFATFARLAPCYRDDLHLVAVAGDGSFAAHVGLAWEPTGRIGIVEPVCTHPDHRRRGLAGALLEEGMGRLAGLGAIRAAVATGVHAPANRLYGAAGFEVASRGRFWRRRV